MEQITKLLENHKWKQLYKIIQSKDIKSLNINGTNLFHILCNMNAKKIFIKLIKDNPSLLDYRDNKSYSCFHIFAKMGYYDLLQYCLIKYPEYKNSIDQNNNSILHFIYDTNIISFILEKIQPDINIKNAMN